jgi:hypothetical protein
MKTQKPLGPEASRIIRSLWHNWRTAMNDEQAQTIGAMLQLSPEELKAWNEYWRGLSPLHDCNCRICKPNLPKGD